MSRESKEFIIQNELAPVKRPKKGNYKNAATEPSMG